MLNSNIDRNIKRLLSKIGHLEKKAKLYCSFYYKVIYPDGQEVLVRFSDHFSEKFPGFRINIIKTSSGFYTIKDDYTGVCNTLESTDVVAYIKRYLTVFPEVYKSISGLKKAAKKAEELINKLNTDLVRANSKYSKYLDLFEEVDSIIAQSKEYKSKATMLEKQVIDFKKVNSDLKSEIGRNRSEISSLKAKIDKYQSIFNKIKNII